MTGQLPIIPPDREDDLRGLQFLDEPDLIVFMAGNQFMVMPELIEAFQSENPDIKKIFYETLPPGLELNQILAGGAIFRDIQLPGTPDVYTSVTEEAMVTLKQRNLIDSYYPYLRNRLVLITQKGNPKGIKGVEDLARDDVRVSQPGDMENITEYIKKMYIKAGGEKLLHRIMEEKRAEGTTIYTIVHHRETPLRLLKGTVDVGPVWATEAEEAKRKGYEFETIELGPELDQSDSVLYYVAQLKTGPNPEAGRRFVNFILSQKAKDIYRQYGFIPV